MMHEKSLKMFVKGMQRETEGIFRNGVGEGGGVTQFPLLLFPKNIPKFNLKSP